MSNKTKIMSVTAGAAALAGLATLAKALHDGRLSGLLRASGPTVLHVDRDESEWVVRIEGVDDAGSRYGTKKEALRHARTFARDQAPSRLVVHRQDGSVQQEHDYEEATP